MKPFLLFLLLPAISFSQHKVDSYKASNGITYHAGDTVKLNMGSDPNGDFRYLVLGGWGALATNAPHKIGKGYAFSNVVIKKVMTFKQKGAQRYVFIVGGGNITNYELYIEEAIQVCEIKDCGKKEAPVVGAADELKKWKALLDSGAITKEEYDAQKKKLLGN